MLQDFFYGFPSEKEQTTWRLKGDYQIFRQHACCRPHSIILIQKVGFFQILTERAIHFLEPAGIPSIYF